MDDDHLSYYMSELTTQIQYAVIAAGHLNSAYTPQPGDSANTPVTRALAAAQALLGAAGVVSKNLWSSSHRAATQERAARLLEILGIVGDDFPLLRNRAVRDSLEHIDERIDGYLVGKRPPLDLARIEAGLPPPALVGDPLYLRRLDPVNGTVEVLGRNGTFDKVPVNDLVAELNRVQRLVTGWFNSELEQLRK